MWAVLDSSNIVTACVAGVSYEEALEQTNNSKLIKMTLENSPATIGNIYKDGKFYSLMEEKNG